MDMNELQMLLAGSKNQENPEDQYLAQLGQSQEPQEYDPNLFSPPEELDSRQAMSERGSVASGSLEDKYNRAARLANSNQGLGSLAGAIQTLFLGPKLKRQNELMEGNRMKAQNLAMEANELKNLRDRQIMEQQQSIINKQKSADAYFRFNTGISSNPMEDARIAGIEMFESGQPKTNYQKLMEMPTSKGMDIQGLVKFAPGLMDMLSQPYSHLTAEALRSELDKAGQQKRMFDDNLNKIRAGISSRNYDDEVAALRAYAMGTSQMVRMMQDAAEMQFTNPELSNELMKNVTENINLYSTFAQNRGLKNTPNPKAAAKGLFDYGKGDPQGLQMVIQGLIQSGQEAGKKAQVPKNAAKNVKEKKAPLPVDVEKLPVQAAAPSGVNQSALDFLGEGE